MGTVTPTTGRTTAPPTEIPTTNTSGNSQAQVDQVAATQKDAQAFQSALAKLNAEDQKQKAKTEAEVNTYTAASSKIGRVS